MINTFLLGINAVMAQFSHVNPYRWPGWYITVLALVAATIVLLCFSEPRSWTCGKGSINCSCITGLRLSAQLKSKAKTRFMVSSFSYYNNDSNYMADKTVLAQY